MRYQILVILLIILFFIQPKKELFENIRKLIYVHIPKTGGTSVEKYGKKHGIKWGRHMKFPRPNKKINSPYWHLPPNLFNKKNTPYKGKKFTIVRNPYDRAVSEYKYRFEIWSKKQDNVSKKGLNNFMHDLEKKIKKNKYCYDSHFLPQHEFIDENTEVIKLENIEKDFPILMKKYNLPEEKLPKTYKTSDKVTKYDLDKKSIEFLNKIYDKDFEKFGYNKITK